MVKTRKKYIIATVSLVLVCIFALLIYKPGFTNAEAYQNVVKDAVILKLNTNKIVVNGESKLVDDENPRTMPYLDKNSRTLVPLRCISENFGAIVEWNDVSKIAIIKYNGNIIKFTINGNEIDVNGIKTKMDTAAVIYEDRTYIPLRALVELGLNKQVYWDNQNKLIVISTDKTVVENNMNTDVIVTLNNKLDSLSTVGNYNELVKLLKTNNNYYDMLKGVTNDALETTGAAEQSPESARGDEGSTDYSSTNTQVKGVDEADIVKNDGRYIYYLSYDKLVIVDTINPSSLKIIKEIEYKTQDGVSFSPSEMYLDKSTLTVIGTETEYLNKTSDEILKLSEEIARLDTYPYPYYQTVSKVKVYVYNISNPNNIIEQRNFEVEGQYSTSRKIGDNVYIISNKYINTYSILEEGTIEDLQPTYRDSVVSNQDIKIAYTDIKYFPEIEESSYTMITTINVNSLLKANIETFLGASQNIYMSNENLYIAQYMYSYYYPENNGTIIYKFAINNDKATFVAKAKVDGTVLNQFSMDEYEGNFRVATTVYEYSFRAEERTVNQLHVFDSNMKETGKITDMAPGERIYSVRFLGAKGYIVTFRQVDPLFVIDLADPTNPKVLGELKIPGFSEYLHPYDENHIIGFGKETQVIQTNYGERVIEIGMKMSMFDVTDMTNPKQLFVQKIGDRGTYSDILTNHKALLFSKDKNLLAFPIYVTTSTTEEEYGDVTFIGSIVYSVDLEKGFVEKGRISHIAGTINEEIYSTDYYNNSIERIIYIGNNLFTVSKAKIRATQIDGIKKLSEVDIKIFSNDDGRYYIMDDVVF